ncbi:monodehydroascorbate reductase [Tanacetum coccineum]
MTNDMYQPWRALATIINLCLTGKTSGFERPRAPVLQILWGVVNGANIDYAERIWEEFTQCIHSFTEDKMNLALHAEGKKKVNPLVILGVRFTKLIINHLQSKHKFHKRPGSPLHLPTEESALGYLKFSFKNTKRVRFGMAIPDTLISEEIRTAAYYSEYVAKVTKYQRYLAGEAVSDDDAPAPKPAKGATTKSTRKPKPQSSKTAPVAKPAASKTSKSSASQPSKPTPAPAKPQQKKRKLVEDTTEAPSQAKRSKAGKVLKKRTLSSTPQLVDEFVDEGVPDKEPMHGDEEADTQRAIEESLKEAQGAHRGPLPPVVFREPDTGKIQPLPEVEGKGKEKVGEEQAAQVKRKARVEQPGMLAWVSAHQTYPKVQENLKLLTEGDVRLRNASSAGTCHLKNLDKEFSFTDQFLVEKSQEDEPEKTNTEAEVQSMVTVPIHQDTSSVPLMTTPVIDITDPQSDSTTVPASMPTNKQQREQTVEFIDSQEIDRKIEESVKEVVTASVQHAMRAPLRARFKDLPTSDMKEILLQRMLEENYDKGHEDHKMAFEALQKSIIRDESEQFDADKAEERTKKKRASVQTGTSDFRSKIPPSHHRLSTIQLSMKSRFGEAQDMGLTIEDSDSWPFPKVSLNQEWFKPLSEEERPATPEPAWSIPSSSLPVPNNNWASAIASSFVSPPENSLLSQTGDIGVFIDWFCKKQGITELTPEHLEVSGHDSDLILLQQRLGRYYDLGHKGDRLALSITKMKAASYPDAGLEQMVPDQMWAEEEYMYDISASYGISHWWFKRQQFYIDEHLADPTEELLSGLHGFLLRRADNQEYTIAESDFKDLYPSDFEDLYLLNLQGQLMNKEFSYQKMGRRLPARHRESPDSAEPHQTSLESYRTEMELSNLNNTQQVTNRFTLIVLSALRRSDTENRQVGPHGSEGSSKDGDGDTSFQWSQFTTPCSHLMFLINDIMTTERPTTQLPQL